MTVPLPAAISKREAQVLGAVRERLSNAEIAERLHVSVRTVESHVSALLRKLQAADRRELASRPGLGATTPPRPAGAPAQWTSFVGRDAERRLVSTALGSSRVVTMLGPGGMGKTRLAAVVATEFADALAGGSVWVDLVGVQPESLHQAAAAALGVREEPDRALDELIVERLGQQPALLVLDNCEHIVEAVAEFATSVLASCREVTLLATSRRRIDIPGEHVVMVPPLAQADAVQLFIERAGDRDGSVDEARRICERLEGMPLPIELAAARVSSLGLPDVLAALDGPLDFLARSRRTDPRHSSVRAVLDWSFGLLDDEERALFARLGVFAGGFDLSAVGAVALDDGARAADVLGRLVDDSLAVRMQTAAGTRWRLLELVRAYAVEQLRAAGETEPTRAAHARWAAESAVALEQRLGSADQGWRAEFDAIVDDLRAARDGQGLSDDRRGVSVDWHALVPALAHLLYASGFLAEARETYLKAADGADSPGEAVDALVAAADIALAEFDGTGAFGWLIRAAGVAAEAGDGAAEAVCLARAVITATRLASAMRDPVPDDRLAALVDCAQRALPAEDSAAAAAVAQARAGLVIRAGLAVADAEPGSDALAMARSAGDPLLISGALDTLAMRELGRGALREAYACTAERVGALRAVARHDPRGAFEITDLYRMLVEVGTAAGALPETLRNLDAFRDDAAVTPRQRATESAWPLALAGRFDQAIAAARVAWAAWEPGTGRPPRGLDEVALAVAYAHGVRGDDARSAEWFARADRVQYAVGRDPARNDVRRYCEARIALFRGDVARAARVLSGAISETSSWYHARPDFVVDEVYVWSLGAELAVLTGAVRAERILEIGETAAAESDWAAGYLARARGRLTGSRAALDESISVWERMDARFERACTLLLLKDRAAEGERELDILGCPIRS